MTRLLAFLLLALVLVSAPCAGQDDDFDPSMALALGQIEGNEVRLQAWAEAGGPYRQARVGVALYRAGDPARALWAFESARLNGMRFTACWDNADVCREELGVSEAGWSADLRWFRETVTPREWTIVAGVLHGAAAFLLMLLWRRRWARVLGSLALVAAVAVSLELLWLGPARPPGGIVLEDVPVVSEPSDELEPIFELRPGERVEVLGGADVGDWRCIRVGDKVGYVPVAAVALLPRS